jgi:hypothetical protein
LKTSLGQMNGVEWEAYCQKLLHLRYRNDYQEVPAQFGGDYGIEGFTLSGIVFQCYCPDEDLSEKELYEHQRNKITRDIRKLIKNAPKISALGVGIIKEWHFLTPFYKHKELIAHCRSKELEVRSIGLEMVDDNFIIKLQVENDYIPECQIFLQMGVRLIQPSCEEPQPEELDAFLTSQNEIVYNIKTKLSKIAFAQERMVRDLVRGYIIGQGELQSLNDKFPPTFVSIKQLKSAIEKQLEIIINSGNSNDGTILFQILKDYEQNLTRDFSGIISSALIKLLSMEAISDWLGTCPLDFH